MKKILVIFIVLMAFMLSGCMGLMDYLAPDPIPDPVPILVMEANVDAVLVKPELVDPESEEEVGPHRVAWSIENVGDIFIREYVITFDVFYPMETKDNVVFVEEGKYLEIGDKHEGILELLPYDTPETVSVSWEIFD